MALCPHVDNVCNSTSSGLSSKSLFWCQLSQPNVSYEISIRFWKLNAVLFYALSKIINVICCSICKEFEDIKERALKVPEDTQEMTDMMKFIKDAKTSKLVKLNEQIKASLVASTMLTIKIFDLFIRWLVKHCACSETTTSSW